MSKPAAAAFFDVDETLVGIKTMFSFLRFHVMAAGRPERVYLEHRDALSRLVAEGHARTEVNRAYYRIYAGVPVEELREQGEHWFAEVSGDEGFFHQPAVQALHRHQAQDDQVVLVSGSFFPCLDPIARTLGADDVLGTSQCLSAGRLTGEVTVPMIGEAKSRAAADWAGRRGIALAACHAYGDHATDLPLLDAVGHPVAVGEDPVLVAYADRRGGRRLPGVTTRAF